MAIPSDRNLTSIRWFIDGTPYENSGSTTGTRFSCAPGQSYTIKYVVYLSPPPPPGGERFEASLSIVCRGKPVKIAAFDCDTGGALIFCFMNLADGTPPFTITWTVNGVVKPQFTGTGMRIGCTVGRSFAVDVFVRDQAGTTATAHAGCVCSRNQQ